MEQREPAADEYLGHDGLIYCRLCGKPKQYRYKLWDVEKVVDCRCDCEESDAPATTPFDGVKNE